MVKNALLPKSPTGIKSLEKTSNRRKGEYRVEKISRSELLTVAILFMTLLIEGIAEDFLSQWMRSFTIALPIVYPLALGMLQVAKRVVARIDV
jgi:Protein of unknown function (DUF2798)